VSAKEISEREKNEPRLDVNATEWIAERSRRIVEMAEGIRDARPAVFMGNWHSDGWIVFYERFITKYPHLSSAFEDYAALHQTWLMRHAKKRGLWKEEYGLRDYRPPLDLWSLSTTQRKRAANNANCVIILILPSDSQGRAARQSSANDDKLSYEIRIPRPSFQGYYEPKFLPYQVGKPVYVSGYTRRNGTYVQPHFRSLPRR
jgi:hypothetical protein